MSDPRGSWDDERLDRLLERAVAVEPSPGLRARVRARVASEAERSARRALFAPWMAAAAVIVVVLGVALGSRWIDVGPRDVPGPETALVGHAPAPLAATTTAAVVPPMPRVSPRPPAPERVVRARASAPVEYERARPIDARFAPGDREAFLMLLAMSRTGALPQVDALPPVTPEPDVTVSAIEITQIDIVPAATPGVDQGEPR